MVDALEHTAKVWKDACPSSGRHPDGELFELLWTTFATNLHDRLETAECVSGEQKQSITAIRTWIKLTIHAPDSQQPGNRRTTFVKFQPVGKQGRGAPPEDRPWVWIIRFGMGTQKGREAHEETLHIGTTLDEYFGTPITRDNGPKDGLERELEKQLAALRL